MVDRIEKISGIKGVLYDAEGSFRREEYEEGRSGKKFSDVLKSAMKKRSGTSPVPEAYKLDISRATQSLFYQGLANLGHITKSR